MSSEPKTLEDWKEAYESVEASWNNLNKELHSVLKELKDCKKELIKIKLINDLQLSDDDKRFINSII